MVVVEARVVFVDRVGEGLVRCRGRRSARCSYCISSAAPDAKKLQAVYPVLWRGWKWRGGPEEEVGEARVVFLDRLGEREVRSRRQRSATGPYDPPSLTRPLMCLAAVYPVLWRGWKWRGGPEAEVGESRVV